jgi:pyruvate kinase
MDVNQATPHDHQQAVCEAAVSLAERGDAKAIVAVTRRGGTARRLSALRPGVPIIAVAQSEVTARRLSLYWGITPLFMHVGEQREIARTEIARALIDRQLAAAGTPVVFVNISPDLTRHDANYLRIQRL